MAKRATIPPRTEAELQYVKRFVLLPIVLDVLERDMTLLDTVPLKMPTLYIQMLRGVQQQATNDLATMRRKLREHGMRVYEQRRTRARVEAAYLCRGYHYHFAMQWDVVRAEVEESIRSYLKIEMSK